MSVWSRFSVRIIIIILITCPDKSQNSHNAWLDSLLWNTSVCVCGVVWCGVSSQVLCRGCLDLFDERCAHANVPLCWTLREGFTIKADLRNLITPQVDDHISSLWVLNWLKFISKYDILGVYLTAPQDEQGCEILFSSTCCNLTMGAARPEAPAVFCMHNHKLLATGTWSAEQASSEGGNPKPVSQRINK